MKTLKQFFDLFLLFLLLGFVLIARLFKWRPAEETGMQTLFAERPKGFAYVSASESDLIPYPYIYIDADGNARELTQGEREDLQTPWLGSDGERPYVKWRYKQKNGWGESTGFLKRTRLPRRVPVSPAPPDDISASATVVTNREFLRSKGYDVVENADGSYTATPSKIFRTEL